MIGSLASIAGLELRDIMRRNIRTIVLLGGASVFFIGGTAYGLSALSRVLSELYGPLKADLMIGGGLLVIGLIIALASWLVHRRPRSADTRAALAVAAAPLALSLGRKFAPSLIKVTPLVLIAGILAGRAMASGSRDE